MEEERFPNLFYKAALFWYHDQTKTAQKKPKNKKQLLTINLIKIYAKILDKILASQIQQYINIRKLNQVGFIMWMQEWFKNKLM